MEWKFNDTMSFLVPHLQPKRSGINISRLVNSVWHHWLLRTSFYLRFFILFIYIYIYSMCILQNKKNLGKHNSKRGNISPSSVDVWI